jgi:hypothetical protein
MTLGRSVGLVVGTSVAAPRLAAVALAERGHTLVALTTDEPGDTAPIGLITGYDPGDTLLVGIDHHPRTGALRIVSDTGQNLRHPFTGTSDLPGLTTAEDTPLGREGVSGVAYTGSARLFGVDTAADQVVAIGPSGAVSGLGEPGALGDLVGSAGLDIHTATTPEGPRDTALAVVRRTGVPLLLSVDLADGTARRIGRFDIDVVDLAVVPAAEPAEEGTP